MCIPVYERRTITDETNQTFDPHSQGNGATNQGQWDRFDQHGHRQDEKGDETESAKSETTTETVIDTNVEHITAQGIQPMDSIGKF